MTKRAALLEKNGLRVRLFKLSFIFLAGLALSFAALVETARADILELKDGQIIQGRFLSGSPLNIRFEVDGTERVFATKDVLNIGFSDTGNASNSAPPPAASAPPPPPPVDQPAAPPEAPPARADSGAPPPTATRPPAAAYDSTPEPNARSTQAITIPANTSLLVRMIDEVDSTTSKIGDPFQASLESALVVGDTVVAPKGADVFGELRQVKSAGKISGAPQLTLALTGIRINGRVVPVDSTTYDVAGKSRGSQSAERIGGGAVVGAVIGAIAGGGKGAAIGATVGAGAGTAVQVMTHGERLRIPSETLLEFKLEHDVTAPLGAASN